MSTSATKIGTVKSKAVVIGTIAVATIASLITGAHAQEATDVSQVKVTFAPATIITEQGAKKLYSKLQASSRAVCDVYQSRDLAKLAHYRACYQTALENAVADVNQAQVTALHREHGPSRLASSPKAIDAAA